MQSSFHVNNLKSSSNSPSWRTEWEKLERETNHERLLTMGNKERVVEKEVGGRIG